MELFLVTSTVDGLIHNGRPFDRIKVTWFMVDRKWPQVSYAEVIKDYKTLSEKDRPAPCSLIKELMTEKEAFDLRAYLQKNRYWKSEIIRYDLPIDPKSVGFRRRPVDGSSGFYKVCDHAGYDLEFRVWGLYDVKGLAPNHTLPNLLIRLRNGLLSGIRRIVGDGQTSKHNIVV